MAIQCTFITFGAALWPECLTYFSFVSRSEIHVFVIIVANVSQLVVHGN